MSTTTVTPERWGWSAIPTTDEVVGFLKTYLTDLGETPIGQIGGLPHERRRLLPHFLAAVLEYDAQLRGEFDEVARASQARERAQKITDYLDVHHRNREGRIEPHLYAPARELVDQHALPDDSLLCLGKLMFDGLGVNYRGACNIAYDTIVALQQPIAEQPTGTS